ncbi:MAG TPA: DUF1330 domain-containing protein [Candidatus Acidoferrales bacterium]|nr:DUF1330 domain-containing protein [Candidatus Acidoferrales bacterium]
MKCYAIGELDLIDQSWVADYVENVTSMVERRGGRYLARTSNIDQLEGDGKPPQVVVLIEWPSKEIALEFYESNEYRPYRDSRFARAKSRFSLIAGEDIARVAQIDN